MPTALAERPTTEPLVSPREYDNWSNIMKEIVAFAVQTSISPDLLERQVNLNGLFGSNYTPIKPGVRVELGRSAPDSPLTYIDNVEYIRAGTVIGLGAVIGRQSLIHEQVEVKADAQVGSFCLIGHHVEIGEGAEISDRVGIEYGIIIPDKTYIPPGELVT